MKHIRILPRVYEDPSISPLALKAFCLILDCVEGGTTRARLSHSTLAKRLSCARSTAQLLVQSLIEAGHIRKVQTAERECAIYDVLSHVPIPAYRYRAGPKPEVKPQHGFIPQELSPEERAASQAARQRVTSGFIAKRVPA
jgi:hypothetical protein